MVGSGREFPSFTFLDASNEDTAEESHASIAVGHGTHGTDAPLRFTLNSSNTQVNHQPPRPKLVRPTLISPPGRRGNDGSTSTLTSTQDAPLFPSIEEFQAKACATKSLKRPPSEMPPLSFLPYKKRAIANAVSSDFDEASRRSPTYLQRLAENEPRMKEAASILLDLKSLVATSESEDTPSEPRSVSQVSSFASLTDAATTDTVTLNDEVPVANPPIEDQVVETTRTVTPAPLAPTPGGMRLAFPEDKQELNSLHCFVRAELLEVFALPDEQDGSSRPNRRNSGTGRSYSSGRVGLRCVYCAHLPRRARTGSTMSSFYPKSLNDIYRSVCTWQRIHFKTCRHIPPQVRQGYWQLKESDRTRGKTRYWVSSAQRLGLVDIAGSERGGICFANTTTPTST